jgi:hypothetical protein
MRFAAVLIAALALASSAAAATFAPSYNLDPGGGYALPTCGANDFYTLYNWNHEVWTCLLGSWYYGGSW